MEHVSRLIGEGMLSVFQIRLAKMWERTRGAQRLPEFQAFDFDSIRDLLENILICEVDGYKSPHEFVVSSHGKIMTEMRGADCSGRKLGDILPYQLRAGALQDYATTALKGIPTFRQQTIPDGRGQPVSFEQLLLPFGVSRQETHRIVCAVYLFTERNGFDRRLLLVER